MLAPAMMRMATVVQGWQRNAPRRTASINMPPTVQRLSKVAAGDWFGAPYSNPDRHDVGIAQNAVHPTRIAIVHHGYLIV